MHEYARDVRSHEKMIEDFRIGKENEQTVLEHFSHELQWRNQSVQSVTVEYNNNDKAGEFGEYKPDGVFKVLGHEGKITVLNIEVKCTGFKLKDPVFVKAGQIKWLKQFPNAQLLIADPDKYICLPLQRLLQIAGEPQRVVDKKGKEFYLLPHKRLMFSRWTYGCHLKKPKF